jgi:hypothetical protein
MERTGRQSNSEVDEMGTGVPAPGEAEQGSLHSRYAEPLLSRCSTEDVIRGGHMARSTHEKRRSKTEDRVGDDHPAARICAAPGHDGDHWGYSVHVDGSAGRTREHFAHAHLGEEVMPQGAPTDGHARSPSPTRRDRSANLQTKPSP